jgi:hypothetical protein
MWTYFLHPFSNDGDLGRQNLYAYAVQLTKQAEKHIKCDKFSRLFANTSMDRKGWEGGAGVHVHQTPPHLPATGLQDRIHHSPFNTLI